ncbi:MAG: tetratricopeptide repeat protein, partial [Armatimonadota bacterium]|nr:tetratricopeptide repeat protein [Armatimonadota bacterium]
SAKNEFEEAIRLDPNYVAAQENLKRALVRLGGSASMRADDYYNFGMALANQGKLDDAVAQFCEAVRLKPDHLAAWDAMGATLLKQGRIEEAGVCYNKILEIDPHQPAAHDNLALVFYLQGEYSNAWREIMLCRKYGGTPNPNLVKLLEAKVHKP